MRRLRVKAVAALSLSTLVTIFAAAAVTACGDDDNTPAGSRLDGGVGLDVNQPAIDAAPPAADAGTFSIEDVADTPCAVRGGPLKEVYAPNATTFRPLSLVAVGARRAMRTDDGVVLMDADGANASAQLLTSSLSISEIASTPNALVTLGADGVGLKLARFDASGAATGPSADVAPSSTGLGAAGGDGKVLVAWAQSYDLRAVAYGDQGTALAPPFTFRSGITEVQSAAFAVAHAGGDEFGVASVGQFAGTHRLVFTRVSTTTRVSTSYTLIVGTDPIRLVGIAHLEANFAILVERRVGTVTEVLLVVLDARGRFAGPTRRLLGVRRAFGVASSGGEIGVVAWRKGVADGDENLPDAVELRPFDAAGLPLGSWVCLDEPFTVPTVDVGAAILGEANGYTVLMRTPKHAVAMARVDRRGTAGQ